MRYVEVDATKTVQFDKGVCIPDEYYHFFGIDKDARTDEKSQKINLFWRKNKFNGNVERSSDGNYYLTFENDLITKLRRYCRIKRNILASFRIFRCSDNSYEIQFIENDELKESIELWFIATTLAMLLPFIALFVMHHIRGDVFPNSFDQFQNGESMLSLCSITIPFFFSTSVKSGSNKLIKHFFAILLYAVQIAFYCSFKADSVTNPSPYCVAVRAAMTVVMILTSSFLYYAFQTEPLLEENHE